MKKQIAELKAELKQTRRVRDAWCREYVKARNALRRLERARPDLGSGDAVA